MKSIRHQHSRGRGFGEAFGRGPGRHGHGGFGRGRGSGRGRRPFGHGDLRLLLLSLIDEAPSHGYGLIGEINQRTGGLYEPSAGVIYPALELLQDQGLAEVKNDDGKKVYHITEAGRAELASEGETIAAIRTRLEELSGAGAAPEPGDVRAAMRQLRHAVMRAATAAGDDASKRESLSTRLIRLKDEIEAGL